MANDSNPKDQTKVGDIFSISFEDDFEGMPGVTQLLNPKARPESTQGKPQTAVPPPRVPLPAAFQPPTTPEEAPKDATSLSLSVDTLADFGVQFELHFKMERGVFRYSRMKGHTKSNLSLWQEKFYFHMRLDLQVLGVKDKFQEFTKEKDFFQADAFALTGNASFIQVVRLDESNSQTCIVLISEKSLTTSAQKIRELLNQSVGKGPGGAGSDDDEFKIELAS